jgi:hypothetical protein
MTGFSFADSPFRGLYGCQFAPRYSDIREKVGTSLYGFQHPTKI